MKVGRQYLGKYAEITWRDPGTARTTGKRAEEAPRGIAALATWKERGVIDDLTDDIVRIAHSEGYQAGHILGRDDIEWSHTWVPAGLIESIAIYEPVKTEGDTLERRAT